MNRPPALTSTGRASQGLAGWTGMALVLLALGGCQPRDGDRCFCHGDCRSGLECAANGQTLDEGECVTDVNQPLQSGQCVDADEEVTDDVDIPPRGLDTDRGAPDDDNVGPPGPDADGGEATASGTSEGSGSGESTAGSASAGGAATDTSSGSQGDASDTASTAAD